MTAKHIRIDKSSLVEPHSVSYSDFACEKGTLTSPTPHLWAGYAPFSPKTAFEIITRDLNLSKIDISIRFQNDPRFAPALNITGPDLSYTKEFGAHAGCVGAGYIEIKKSAQGNNTGRKLVRNVVEFFSLCGHQHESYDTAGAENGGFTWAKYGLLPFELDEEVELYQAVQSRIRIAWDVLTDVEKTYISQYKELKDPKDLWGIADADFDFTDRFIHFKNPQQLEGAFSSSEHGPKAFKRLFEMAHSGRKISLGQYCLTATSWGAVLDYTSVEQMTRISNYTGGFKYLSFE
jgi:hypothetical protein